jgi:polygalacturonase
MKKVFFKSLFLSLFCVVAVKVQAQTKPYSWDNLPVIIEPVFKKDTISIVKYGAKPDGVSLNTKAINEAISACSANGGGVVLIPNGFWLTGPIQLQSNVNLHLEKNALVLFSKNFDDYKIIAGNYEGVSSAKNESPIMGTNLENIAITGKGVIDGNGDVWRMVGRNALTESEWKAKVASGGLVSDDGKMWYPSEKAKKADIEKRSPMLSPGVKLEDFAAIKDFLRPNLIVLTGCKNVLLEGVTFQNSPAWNVHPIMCENLTLRNLFIKNPDYARNGDGADIESCKNVLVENCIFDVGDDAICIKSGKDEEGRKRGMPTENMIVRNNTVYKGHGGFVVGSEMSGGARNIFVYDCTFMGTDKGIRFKTTRGRGGVVENIYIKDINMVDIVHEAIYFDMYYWVKPPKENEVVEVPKVTEATPIFRNIYMENIVCNGAQKGVFVRGIPEMPVSNIYMENLVLNTEIGVEIKDAKGIYLKNCDFRTKSGKEIIYIETSQDVSFDGIKSNQSEGTLFNINGESSSKIAVKNSSFSPNLTKAVFNNKASSKSIKFN